MATTSKALRHSQSFCATTFSLMTSFTDVVDANISANTPKYGWPSFQRITHSRSSGQTRTPAITQNVVIGSCTLFSLSVPYASSARTSS
jgi:hypothetical protein